MARSQYDPELATASVRRLRETTDAEIVADIRTAAAAVFQLVDEHPGGVADLEGVAAAAVSQTRRALSELSDGAAVGAAVAAVRPLLNVWWPDIPASARRIAAAVETLRAAAMHRPGLVSEARYGLS